MDKKTLPIIIFLTLSNLCFSQTPLHNSVLASGDWYKLHVQEDGIYKITYQELNNLGINVNSIDPRTLKIYGNGGRMLPENTSDERYDDLHEVPITVYGEEDGSFDSGDYILFYGDGPDEWHWSEKREMYLFKRNIYSRSSGYFLTYGGKQGRRMSYKEEKNISAEQLITSYVDCQAIEQATVHLTKSGRRWFGDRYESTTKYDYTFSFPELKSDEKILFAYAVAARATATSYFTVTTDNFTKTHSFRSVGTSLSSAYAFETDIFDSFEPESSNITVNIKYTRPNNGAIGWMRYIYLNAFCQLKFNSGTLFFRYPTARINSQNCEFHIQTGANNVIIADITDPAEPMLVNYTYDGSTLSFTDILDEEKEYVCFDGTNVKSVTFEGKIANQNIHGMSVPEMVIIYHEDFYDAAQLLHNFHTEQGLKTYLINIQDIYNEFSSGVQDICAIRDMMRYWYKNAEGDLCPKYLLLVGDASYDPLDRLNNNTNFIPIFQSEETLLPSYSYNSDDFYGFLSDGEGNFESDDLLDISVGRLPVQTEKSALEVVNKIIHYANNSSEQKGDWRNIVTLVCDDADNTGSGYETRHLDAAEKYASIIENSHKAFKTNKIYAGAYPQVTAAGGQRYPEVNDAINARMEQGTLVFGYNGHGSELCLALEQIVSIADINSWSNYDRLSFMVTATCEFSRFDDPARTSAGELVLLNPKGGSFSMLTTSRLTDASTNYYFCSILYENMFKKKSDGSYPTVGEFVMESKNTYILNGHSFLNITPYAILGDPAIPINYPKYNSVEINKINIDGLETDTIRALSLIEIEGQVNGDDGNILSSFNGMIYPEFRDKQISTSTLGNDGAPIQYFSIDKSILYKGKAAVNNGKFKISFITPKDIAYNFGKGKANFYFTDDDIDGNGYFENYIVGGSSNSFIEDNDGPQINMYINDVSFKDGDMTNENPTIYATIYDKSGINTTGNGIGHDLIATIDDDSERTYILNTYFEANMDSYQKGTISYPLFNLDEGPHRLYLRAWDVCNNSSSAELNFVVVNSEQIKLAELVNYPNPFSDETTFALKHNQAGQTLSIELYIYSINGKLINRFTSTINSTEFYDEVYRWNGENNNGTKVSQGIYVYKVVITNEDGTTNYSSGKLIKL